MSGGVRGRELTASSYSIYSAFIITVTAYHRGEVAIYLVLVPVLALLFYLDRRYRGRVRMQNQVLPGPEGG